LLNSVYIFVDVLDFFVFVGGVSESDDFFVKKESLGWLVAQFREFLGCAGRASQWDVFGILIYPDHRGPWLVESCIVCCVELFKVSDLS